MSAASNEYAVQSFLRQSAHRVIDERHSLSTDRWDLERRFVVLSEKDLLETGAEQKQKEEGPAMNSLLDSLTTMCVCTAPRRPKWSKPPSRKKRRIVYPVEGFSTPRTPLNSPHVVKKRLSKLPTNHFFRPVSEDDLISV